MPKIIPTPETIELRVVDVFNPRFSYGGGKLAGELIVFNYLKNTDVRYGIFRPHNIYGPQMGFEHVIPQLSKKILIAGKCGSSTGEVTVQIQGTGEETRSFIFIDAIPVESARLFIVRIVRATLSCGPVISD